MLCPYCGQQMQSGSFKGDGRGSFFWLPAGARRHFTDAFSGRGSIKSARHSFYRFVLEGHYCLSCKKLIFDTDIQK